jgi:microcystin-dependent protein
MNGQKLAIIVNNTNAAGVTLNVDGLGAFPIVTDTSGTAVPAGTMIANSLYDVTFYSSISKFVLHSFFGSPYSIPIGGLLDFTGTSVPNASFVFPAGQQISRTTYSTYFAMVGTTYGVGDGSTTFNVPDLTGRVVAMKEASATRLTSTYFGAVTGGTGATLGAVGGLESHLLTTAQLAAHTHTNTLTDPGHTHNYTDSSGGVHGGTGTAGGNSTGLNATATTSSTTGVSITNASAGGGGAHNNVQPTIILNKILRII